jgi:ABC-2 type transport system permease protein
MITDIRTMIWKESKSLLRYQGRRSQLAISLLTPLIVSAIFPIQFGMDWANGYFSLFVGIAIPLLVVGITVPDAFAGERERHTLETLLASRLPDRVILFGKILVCVITGWVVSILVFMLSLVVLNLAHGQGGVILYNPRVLAAQLALSLGMSLLVATLGVLFSMSAPTVQIAQQNLFTSIMVPMMLIGFIPMIVLLLPALTEKFYFVKNFITNINFNQVVWLGIGMVILADGVLVWINLRRFKRPRLVSQSP